MKPSLIFILAVLLLAAHSWAMAGENKEAKEWQEITESQVVGKESAKLNSTCLNPGLPLVLTEMIAGYVAAFPSIGENIKIKEVHISPYVSEDPENFFSNKILVVEDMSKEGPKSFDGESLVVHNGEGFDHIGVSQKEGDFAHALAEHQGFRKHLGLNIDDQKKSEEQEKAEEDRRLKTAMKLATLCGAKLEAQNEGTANIWFKNTGTLNPPPVLKIDRNSWYWLVVRHPVPGRAFILSGFYGYFGYYRQDDIDGRGLFSAPAEWEGQRL